ncbi:MAG: NAD(P)(+) transhydrogenase (Re/Si-specific) subunit alpha, partial [Xanthomonadales bacterium]|nr:NAD(P)(+) transhydrogenase (Re/Si-specific) subunit alpha [Xanthomonadales bacterium]
MPITVAALREASAAERRVAISPEVASKLKARDVRVLLEPDLGERAGFPDQAYTGVAWADADDIPAQADVLLCVGPPDEKTLARLKQGAIVIGQLHPYAADAHLRQYAACSLSAFSLELLPRITRGQSMDVLSS